MDNLPPTDTYCAVCKKQCLLECLKCHKCKNFIHTDCSNLPVYAIVNFFNTRCQYTCEECARKQIGTNCDQLFAQVNDILEKEREAKQQSDEAGAQSEPEPDTENESVEPYKQSLLNHQTKHDYQTRWCHK